VNKYFLRGDNMGFKKWSVAEYDKNLAKELAYECNVDPIIALIASSRGYTDPMDLEQFISDEPVFSDPTQMADIVCAAEIVYAAIENGEKIAVYGDYDCDGITATALYIIILKVEALIVFTTFLTVLMRATV
jgi:single-stranded-DNA-specific exonuclease